MKAAVAATTEVAAQMRAAGEETREVAEWKRAAVAATTEVVSQMKAAVAVTIAAAAATSLRKEEAMMVVARTKAEAMRARGRQLPPERRQMTVAGKAGQLTVAGAVKSWGVASCPRAAACCQTVVAC